jgi:hypothetical protein
MKFLLALACTAIIGSAQPRQGAKAFILKTPSGWYFERMSTPPPFAPDIKLTGFEEARFAPGMFKTTSSNYFTYVLIVSADGSPKIDAAALKDFLEKYYRGLSMASARQKGLSIDVAQTIAAIDPPQSDRNRCTAQVAFFDTFNDGRKTILNVEARVVARPAAKKTGLILLISPQPKDHSVWRTLHEIESKIDFAGGE